MLSHLAKILKFNFLKSEKSFWSKMKNLFPTSKNEVDTTFKLFSKK